MSELNDNEKYISLLIQSLGKMDERFEQLQQWQELQKKIVENQETKIDNQNKILENQTRLIEMLSSRSVKQEKDIENVRWKQLDIKTDLGSTVDALSAKFLELEAEIKEIKADKDKEAS